MGKGNTALLDKQGKETINEGLQIKSLRSISEVLGFRLYHLNKKGTKSNRENAVKCDIHHIVLLEPNAGSLRSPSPLYRCKAQVSPYGREQKQVVHTLAVHHRTARNMS